MEKTRSLTPLKKYAFFVVLAPLVKLFEVGCELMMPFLTRYIIDQGISNSDWEFTLKMGLLLIGIAIFGFCMTMIAQYLAARVSADYGYDLRKAIYAQINRLSEKQLNKYGKQKVLTLVNNDSFSLQNGVMMFMRLIVRPPFLHLGATIISFTISWKAGLVFVASILLSAVIIGIVMFASPKRYAAIQKNLDEISTISSDSLKGARQVRAFNKQGYEQDKLSKSVDSYEKKNISLGKLNSLINPFTFLFTNLAILFVLYFCRDSIVTTGEITTGQVVSLIQYLVTSLAALIMWSRMIVSINKARASKKRADAFLELEPEIENNGDLQGKSLDENEVFRFEDVSLSYGDNSDKYAVKGLSTSIKKGTWVGIIGGTGSGKSTMIALMERLYEPTKGEIFYHGVPLDEYDLESLRKEISLVSQKPSIFKGTIRSNLLLVKPEATSEEIDRALSMSLAKEYVEKFPDGLDHPVEEAGANLSGGQKQRLLIARAILKGGDILILDDSTSALDYLSDQKVRHNISSIEGLTKILVSQRAASLKDCDLILVFENGEIVAQGKFDDLLQNCGQFRDIYEMQRAQA
ncbi:MAG: ABC transporter ATP-binding protein/permease [Bacilli bacterium]|nr:ABC transporter ATP-binding protein/permease [Bacilli bacterium]